MSKPGFLYTNKLHHRWCGVGIENPKLKQNVGVLFRSAICLGGVDFLFTIGDRYDHKTHADVVQSNKIVPCFNFNSFEELYKNKPNCCETVGVEIDKRSQPLETYQHLPRAIYIFGSEDGGLSKETLKMCRHIIKLPSPIGVSMNLSSAASMVLWDRHLKYHMKDNQ